MIKNFWKNINIIWLCFSQPITTGGVNYRDQPWHKECFLCTGCKEQLAGQRFTSRDDLTYCLNCFCNLFAKKCAYCTTPISGKEKPALMSGMPSLKVCTSDFLFYFIVFLLKISHTEVKMHKIAVILTFHGMCLTNMENFIPTMFMQKHQITKFSLLPVISTSL